MIKSKHKDVITNINIGIVSKRIEKILEESGLDITDPDFKSKFDAFLRPIFEQNTQKIEIVSWITRRIAFAKKRRSN